MAVNSKSIETVSHLNLKVAMAQIAPVWLDREKTTDKVVEYIEKAANQGAELVVFGEALLPGYPFWLSHTGGAEFNAQIQKEIFAHYALNAVDISAGHLQRLCDACEKQGVATYIGTIETAPDRGGKSLYCTLVYIDANGKIGSTHRKLMPTYEERLAWSPGDGHGLRVHKLGAFTLGGLNCWENWLPLARASLYGQGEDFHIAVWPGGMHNTGDITAFIAKELRGYSMSVCGILSKSDVPDNIPHRDLILDYDKDFYANGGSCLANPRGEWIIPPIAEKEGLEVADIDFTTVLEERQNMDSVGHYSRPDVTQLQLNRNRQSILSIED